jgi:beta-galactosidase/beta-glucuronidase
MKSLHLIAVFLMIVVNVSAQAWKPAGEKIRTPWAEKIDPANPLPEYPRPQLVRDQWQNLNGLWDYAIVPKGKSVPVSWEGKILVPYPVESSLSGVQQTVGQENELWYHRTFTIPTQWRNKKVILNFGAVDWKADVWVNDIKVGVHQGGYTPFSFDITPFVLKDKAQKLVVRVWDPSDKGYQPRGKQVENPHGIWYTPVTGIWQTVWIEPVEPAYFTQLKSVPNIDGNNLTVSACIEGSQPGDIIEVKVFDSGRLAGIGKAAVGQTVLVDVPDAKLWSPESPFLYDMEAAIMRNGVVVERVKSYFGMRKISTKRDSNGIVRLQLNNKDYFQLGPLDQGWWPDGLYTAPTDEALLYDIKKRKISGST